MSEIDKLNNLLDELESATEVCAHAQREGPLCYSPEQEHLDAMESARIEIINFFKQNSKTQ